MTQSEFVSIINSVISKMTDNGTLIVYAEDLADFEEVFVNECENKMGTVCYSKNWLTAVKTALSISLGTPMPGQSIFWEPTWVYERDFTMRYNLPNIFEERKPINSIKIKKVQLSDAELEMINNGSDPRWNY